MTANDTVIDAALLSASRSIDGWCGREFNKSAADESRVFDAGYWRGGWSHVVPFVDEWPSRGGCLEVGDLVSVTTIAGDDGSGTYPNTFDADSYVLVPRNAASKGFPFTSIERSPGASWRLSRWPIQVTGIWGWPSVPAPIKEVTFLAANRLKSLWDAPFGLSGGGEMGSLDMTVSLTPILMQMLCPYKVRVT